MRTGYVDLAERDRIIGWAADSAAPDDTLDVAILINGREVGRVPADRLRHDLRNLGTYGDGRHGFVYTIEPPLDPAQEYQVVARFADSDTPLIHGVFTMARQDDAGIDRPAASVDGRERPAQRHEASMARPRYILHVGLPKTGTKYLQSAFWRLRHQLLAHGISYPSEWWQAGPAFAHHALAQELKQTPDARIAEIFSQLNNSGGKTVLLSCEGFITVPEQGLRYMQDLTQGAQIDIVFYTRRWSDWIPSQWQQAVKEGSLHTFPEWYAFVLSNADTHPGIDQAIFIDKFARIFGRKSIKLISYSNLMDNGVDIFEHFCQNVLHLTNLSGMDNENTIVHESLGIHLTELIRCLNAQETMNSGKPGYHIFRGYSDLSKTRLISEDVNLVFSAMESCTATISIDDYAVPLREIYNTLDEYRELILSPEYGAHTFDRRNRPYRFVRGDYLMKDGIADAVRRISEAVRARTRNQSAPGPA